MSGRSEVDNQKIVIFGAGKIGRSFIGQLFGCAGYQVVFIDVNQTIVDGLNQAGSYRVVIKGEKEEEITVPNVQAISALEKEKVIEAVSTAGILAVSVGKNVLEQIVPAIAAGLELRDANNKGIPLDIILAENMRSASDFMREHLMKNLPAGFPLDTLVGLVETSIGKMVPIIPQAELEKDPLVVFAEPYNTLILDSKGFKSPFPRIKGLAPKTNIKAWVDRKAFIHNLGHATAAYYGYSLHKDAVYMYEVLEDKEVLLFTKAVMLQSSEILRAAYPEEFTTTELHDHIDELIHRFRNKALGDTIFRVGHDLIRKLGPDDRFMSPIHFAMQYQAEYDLIVKAMTYGLSFRAKDEEGNCFPSDSLFLGSLDKDFESTLTGLLGYSNVIDLQVIEELARLYRQSGMLTEEGLLH
jgi:mannitol-1-phosphate 5-dehydrogenase